ncbi:hypothetical protein [Ectobacillus sp. sgz5001026]
MTNHVNMGKQKSSVRQSEMKPTSAATKSKKMEEHHKNKVREEGEG